MIKKQMLENVSVTFQSTAAYGNFIVGMLSLVFSCSEILGRFHAIQP